MKQTRNQDALDSEFLLREFEENWAYLRHLEEFRVKLIEIFLLVYGAVLAIVSFLVTQGLELENASANPSAQISLRQVITPFGWIICGLFFFVFLYGLAITIYQAKQKISYEHYRAVNGRIRSYAMSEDVATDMGFETKNNKVAISGAVFSSPFFWWLSSIAALTSSALFFFSIAFSIILGCSIAYGAAWSVMLTLAALGLQLLVLWRHSRIAA